MDMSQIPKVCTGRSYRQPTTPDSTPSTSK